VWGRLDKICAPITLLEYWLTSVSSKTPIQTLNCDIVYLERARVAGTHHLSGRVIFQRCWGLLSVPLAGGYRKPPWRRKSLSMGLDRMDLDNRRRWLNSCTLRIDDKTVLAQHLNLGTSIKHSQSPNKQKERLLRERLIRQSMSGTTVFDILSKAWIVWVEATFNNGHTVGLTTVDTLISTYLFF